jgi:hypothetical protein
MDNEESPGIQCDYEVESKLGKTGPQTSYTLANLLPSIKVRKHVKDFPQQNNHRYGWPSMCQSALS